MTRLFRFPDSEVRRAAGALALAVLLAAAGCGDGAPADPFAGGPPPAMPVEILTMAEQPIEDVGEFVGVLRSRRSTTIQPQAEGFITEILVTSGETVSPGAPLFAIDASPQRAAVASLESQRAAREADAVFARQQAERSKTMFEAGAISRQEYEQAAAVLEAAEAQVQAVDEQIRQQEAELAYYRVVAPTAGIVGDVPVRVGDRVTRSTVLTTLGDNEGLEVYINVPVGEAPNLRPGLPVRLVDEAGAVVATTRVAFVAPSVDDATQSILVKAPVAQHAGRFRADQFVRARLVWNTGSGLKVPVIAVQRINGQFFVFVAEAADGGLVAHQRLIRLGDVVGDGYVLLEGLEVGDRLIVGGTQKIGDGAPVQTMPAGPPPGGGPAPGGPEAARGRGGQ